MARSKSSHELKKFIQMLLFRKYGRRSSSLTLITPFTSPIRKLHHLYSTKEPLPPLETDDKVNVSIKSEAEAGNSSTGEDYTKYDQNIGPEDDIALALELLQKTLKHTNTEVPELPPLPATPIGRDFSNLLKKKCELIKIELNFVDPESDVNAKEIRMNTINELLAVAQNGIDKMQTEDKETLYNTLKELLFKDISPVDPPFLFSDDLLCLTDVTYPQSAILYQILGIYAQDKDLQPEIVKLLFKRFEKFDINERNCVVEMLTQIYDNNRQMQKTILDQYCNVLTTYLDKGLLPYVLFPGVALLYNIFKKCTDLTPYQKIYLNIIMPLLGSLHFLTCSDVFVGLVEQFVKAFPNLATQTILELVRHFPITKSDKAIPFLKMLTLSLTKVTVRDFRKYMKPLFLLFAKCTVGPHIKVSNASLQIWHKIELEPLIMDNAKIIFPYIYPILSQGMKETRSNDIINNIDDVFQTMNRIDTFIFQELCRQKQVLQQPASDFLKKWATIARSSAKSDKQLNLATKLAEIQRIFSTQQLQSLGKTQRNNRSATTIGPTPSPQLPKAGNRSNVNLSRTVPFR